MPDTVPKTTPAAARRLKSIGGKPAVYQEQMGGRWLKRFWVRPTINKHRTWVLLKATERRAAHTEAAGRTCAPRGDTFAACARIYLRAGCPTRKRKWKPAGDRAVKEETAHAGKLNGFYGPLPISEANQLAPIYKYFDWRTHGLKEEDFPTRQIDKEIQTLSNVINYAVFITRQLQFNIVRGNRPIFHKVRSHARDRMPRTAAITHQIAEEFFNGGVRSEVFGWLTFFHHFTGCRHSELLRLRVDAKENEAGHIQRTDPFGVPDHKPIYTGHGYLHLGQRSKSGINPRCILWPEFADMIECFRYWHQQRFPDSPHYFPGLSGIEAVAGSSFNHALRRIRARIPGTPHVTPHGWRASFTTKLVRDGFRYEEVLEQIGDTSLEVLRAGYSELLHGPRLSWNPATGLPGYLRWQPESKKVRALNP